MSSVVDRIKKLLALAANNSNEAEAAAAMAKASSLMLAHGLSESEVNRVAQQLEYGSKFDRHNAQLGLLAHVVNTLYGTTHVTYTDHTFHFLGRPELVQVAEATYVHLVKAVEHLYRIALPRGLPKHERARFRTDFKRACSFRLLARAHEIREAHEASPPDVEGASRALVISHFDNLKSEIHDFLAQDPTVKQRKPRALLLRDTAAAGLGARAGDTIPLQPELKD